MLSATVTVHTGMELPSRATSAISCGSAFRAVRSHHLARCSRGLFSGGPFVKQLQPLVVRNRDPIGAKVEMIIAA